MGKVAIRHPTVLEKSCGLLPKYKILHGDGSPTDREAFYFVLRLDPHLGCDEQHIEACQQALLRYCECIEKHLPVLAKHLRKIIVENDW
jgi:hypothetical protein